MENGASEPTTPAIGEFGPEMKALTQQVPSAMQELMKNYIERRDLRERAIIRMRMKAFLDLFAADTAHPPIPALTPGQRRNKAFLNPMQQNVAMGTAPGWGVVQAGQHLQSEQELLAAAVEEAAQAEADAGVPAISPVPGAEVADPTPAEL